MKKKTLPSDQKIIDAFCKEVYPECTELAMSANSEIEILKDATNLIRDLRREIINLNH